MNFLPRLVPAICLSTLAVSAAEKPLTRDEAEKEITSSMKVLREAAAFGSLSKELPAGIQQGADGKPQLKVEVKSLSVGGHEMPYAVVVKNSNGKPETQLPLFIAMHGGGQSAEQPGPHTWEVNTQEFQTQIKLAAMIYKPDGVYFVPRMADDRLGRWWHKHNQLAFDAVIDHAVMHWNVDPNRVYLMGISEGGYGTDILAPFMADRWAGANAMAAGVGLGNPPANLRNVAFRTDVGEKDTMFDRRPMAEAYHRELDRLHELAPSAYKHSINVQPGRGHGIDYRPGVEWIVQNTRNPWPSQITWINQPMDGLRRERFYWIEMPDAPEKGDIRVDAVTDRKSNSIRVEVFELDGGNQDGNRTHGKDNVAEAPRKPLAGSTIRVLLNDTLLDLDQPIKVTCNGREVFSGKAKRSAEVVRKELKKRPDPSACPTAVIEFKS